MELLKLPTAYCSGDDRNDLSYTLSHVVAVIVSEMPSDTVILGRIFPHNRSLVNDERLPWWLLGYSLKYHMVFAQAVSYKHAAHIMCKETVLRTVDGAVCTFDAAEWRAKVATERFFHELNVDDLNDESVVASFISYPPERFNLELSFSKFKVDKACSECFPYVSDWVELEILSGVRFIDVPDGVKHLVITSSFDKTLLRIPDSVVSCYIAKDVAVQLSISKRFAKAWGYWSAVWGKPYVIKEGFRSSPDGLVIVRG